MSLRVGLSASVVWAAPAVMMTPIAAQADSGRPTSEVGNGGNGGRGAAGGSVCGGGMLGMAAGVAR